VRRWDKVKLLSTFILIAALSWAQSPEGRPPGLYATFITSKGDITARLYEKYTPVAVATFIGLAQGTKAWRDPKTGAMVKRPLYNNIAFHRVLSGEMIQSGDPTGLGTHNCGIRIRDEILPGLRFDRGGKLAMANTGEPNTGGCQFFITTDPVVQWTGKYTIFGDVVSGQGVVDAISRAPVKGDKPVDPVKLTSVVIERVRK
jgi:peptidyl-prolyl cis-trans isomerase A (cyclophilin A)